MNNRQSILISFVIPCYRSEDTIERVVDEICSVAGSRPDEYDFEIVCVNDCSPDGTWDKLCELARKNHRLRAINLASNRGKHTALMAAFRYVKGDYVVAVDDDGETPVPELWRLIEPLDHGYDVSVAKYAKRPVGKMKSLESDFNDYIASKLYGKPRGLKFTNFIVRKRFVCDYIVQYGGGYPMLEGATLAVTRKIATVDMEPRSRLAGKSGFTFKRGFGLWVDGCTTYSLKPLRFAWLFSAVFFVVAITCFIGSLIGGWQWWGLLISLGFSFVFCYLGLLGEYVGRNYLNGNNIPQYAISEIIDCCENDSAGEATIMPDLIG